MPDDITALAYDPVAVWEQFCREAGIEHRGKLAPPPALQEELF